MRNLPDKADGVGDTLKGLEFNSTQKEAENIVTSADIALDPAAGPDTGGFVMLGQAMSGYANAGWGYTDSGTANAHVLAIASNLKSPTKYYDNMIVAYVPGNTNTSTTVTVNVATLGNKNIKLTGGTDPGIGEIINTESLILKYNDSAGYFEIINLRNNFKIGNFTRDMTLADGTQAITGVGFKPKSVIFYAIQEDTFEMSIGFDTDIDQYVMLDNSHLTPGTYQESPNSSIFLFEAVATSYSGNISSMDSDGFTISWNRTGSKTGTAKIGYLATR